MIHKILMLSLCAFLTACSSTPIAHAKPSAPVKIEYTVPENIKTGTQVTTIIRFIAKTDLQNLVVSVKAYSGLMLISDDNNVAFQALKKGEVRDMEVRIELEDTPGYLSVFATTTNTQGRKQSKSIAIRYGSSDKGPDKTATQKIQLQGVVGSTNGERLILMPGELR